MRSRPESLNTLKVLLVVPVLLCPVPAATQDTGSQDWKRAVESLEAARGEQEKKEAAERVARAEAALCKSHGRVILTVDPADADVWVGRKEPGSLLTGDTVWLTPGRHRIFAQGGKPPGTSVVVHVRRCWDSRVNLKIMGRISQMRVENEMIALAPSAEGTAASATVKPRGLAAGPRDELLRALASDPSARVRAQAALGLAVSGPDPEVEKALLTALGDASGMVRGSVAEALGKVGGMAVFQPLCEAGQDRNPFVSKWARRSALKAASRARQLAFSVGGLPEGAFRRGVHGVLTGGEGRRGITFVEAGETAVHLVFEGEVVRSEGDASKASAEVSLKVLALPGVLLWEDVAREKAESRNLPSPAPSVDRRLDPWMSDILKGKSDARTAAVAAAAETVVNRFLKELARTR